jgi:hypothetical protein
VHFGKALTRTAAGKKIKNKIENENVVQTGGCMEKCMIHAENKRKLKNGQVLNEAQQRCNDQS